ncbi:unnamed protein product [Strongylus vulgaris]|uniref:Uncharacterized protein n=1 Tax=Strongylus vulgaris TaxID=40348 RepID=A0A3P7ILJ8_STRVU|nr:unnamed protein product [Strongylus vulgaris]
MIRLTVRPTTAQFPSAKLMVKWAETDDDKDDVEFALREGGGRSGHIVHPLISKNTYNERRYPSALLKAFDDPWLEERRPWMLVKFGYATFAIRNEDLIWKAVEEVINELGRYSVFLEKCPSYYSLSCNTQKESTIAQVANGIYSHLEAEQPSVYPVLLLIDDFDGKFSDFIKQLFAKYVYIFTLSGQEVADIAASSEEYPYIELRDWCKEFSALIANSEGGRCLFPASCPNSAERTSREEEYE